MFEYWAELVSVIDGDTLEARLDLGLQVHYVAHLRLDGFDAAELKGTDRTRGEAARALVRDYLASLGQPLKLHVKTLGRSFERWVAKISYLKVSPGASPELTPLNEELAARLEIAGLLKVVHRSEPAA